ncbi:PLP-dependent aminotransferase family protein [bacterium 210820-DFI.6.37]|nr:PLP-dependent aminotransferase family protein [bacterium 210820-DFI.6.37]
MLLIHRDSKKQIYLQIYEYYRDQILFGRMEADSPLPSTRHLAGQLSVSRNTVETAYQQLLAEGYLYSRPGSGYFISQVERIAPAAPKAASRKAGPAEGQEKTRNTKISREPQIKCNFQYGRLAADSFPAKTWKRITNKVLLDLDPSRIVMYRNSSGEPALKREIAKYIFESRNVDCEEDQIVLCAGLLTVISMIGQMFREKSRRVAVEEPSYDIVRNLFQSLGYTIDPIPLTSDGLDLEVLRESEARLIYITPSHQFPSGNVMSVNNRVKLIQWAAERDAYIIEDDYDSEYRYNSRPLPSLQSLDNQERVIYINTFSKSLAPALRMDYMVLPHEVKRLYDSHFSSCGCTVPLVDQLVLAEFMAGGHWQRHLRRIALENKKIHDFLVSEIQRQLGSVVDIRGNNAGLHFLLEARNGMEESELISLAKENGVLVYPVSQYYYKPPAENNCVLIGFGGLDPQVIPEGVGLLKKAWFR